MRVRGGVARATGALEEGGLAHRRATAHGACGQCAGRAAVLRGHLGEGEGEGERERVRG